MALWLHFSFYIGLKDSQTEEAKFVSLLLCKEQHSTRLQEDALYAYLHMIVIAG